MSRFLLLAALLCGTAAALPLPGGGWVGWNCQPAKGCTLERLDASGAVQARGLVDRSGYLAATAPVLDAAGRTLYLAGRTTLALDAQTLQQRWASAPNERSEQAVLAVSADGKTLARSDLWVPDAQSWGRVKLLDAATGKVTGQLDHPSAAVPTQDSWDASYRTVTALAFSPDGRTLALGSRGDGICLRDLTTGQERTLPGGCGEGRALPHAGQVRSLLWQGGHTLLSAANDGTVKQWDTATLRERSCLPVAGGVSELVQLSPTRLLAVGSDSATLIDAATFHRVARLGPLAGGLQSWRVLGQRLELMDALSNQLGPRRFDARSGQEDLAGAIPLTTLEQGGSRISVRRDLRVVVERGGQAEVLPFFVLPPNNHRVRLEGSKNWTLNLSGPRLTVGAAGWLRVMTMEGDDFQNRYIWNLDTHRLKSCQMVSLGKMGYSDGVDAGCQGAMRDSK